MLKSGLRAAFFCAWVFALSGAGRAVAAEDALATGTVAALQGKALALHLDRAPLWAALLHLDGGQPGITDPQFILSMPGFSTRQELLDTLAYLWGPDSAKAVCRFPARYWWLQARLNAPALPLTQCEELQRFVERAPAQEVALVFASENLAQPSSMMGHLFLKVAGVDRQGVRREHAISFFTDVATLNLPKLFYDSMVVGKQGYFALSPYAEQLEAYVRQEQRTLWEYELRLDDQARALIRFHLLELKQADLTYYFHRYNCATLVKHIVALAAPRMLDQWEWATTPKDVIRAADQARLLEGATVQAPARWRVRSIEGALPPSQARQVREAVNSMVTAGLSDEAGPSRVGYLSLQLAMGYSQYLHEQGERSAADHRAYHRALQSMVEASYPDVVVEASAPRNPLKSPQDSQVSLGYKYQHGQRWWRFGLLPISHGLVDNNEQYFSESELRLFDSAWLFDPSSGRLRLEHLTIYAAKSLLPRDSFTGGWSGEFKIGLEQQFDQGLQPRMTTLVEGGLGVTYRPWPDVDVYALGNGGLGWRHHPYLYIKPEVGVVIREVYDMKSLLTLSHTHRPLGLDGGVSELALTQSKFIDRQTTVQLQARRRLTAVRGAHEASLVLKRLF